MSGDSMIANTIVYIKLLCNNINNRPKYVQETQILFSTCFSRQGINNWHKTRCIFACQGLQPGSSRVTEINQYNRSRHFHISVETTFSYQCGNKFIIRAHFSTYIYNVRNNASFIIVNPITVDSIIFVGINFRKLKKKMASCGYSLSWFVELYQIIL